MTFEEFRSTRVRVRDVRGWIYYPNTPPATPVQPGFVWLGWYGATYEGGGLFKVVEDELVGTLREVETMIFEDVLVGSSENIRIETYAKDMIELLAYAAREKS